MISLQEIQSYYPNRLHPYGAFLLREYLQYKILEILFTCTYAGQFSFLGGTCLRIVHDNQRFSEDLDFDNFNLTKEDFAEVSNIIKHGLEREGYYVEIRNVFSGAFHCYIRFPGLLFQAGLTGHREAKILINLDTEPQGFNFKPEIRFLNKFDVFTSIFTTPIDILLSQKILALTNRRQPKGRDFFDTVFLMGKTKPNYDFLEKRMNISTSESLREHLISTCKVLDFAMLANDVQPFLFNPEDMKRVTMFPKYIETVPL